MNRLTKQFHWFVVLVALCLPTTVQAQIKITLDNKFIDEYKDRILIDTKFVVEKAHKAPNLPKNDGDLHVAGTSDDIRLPVVAELMNAKFERDAMDAIHDVEGKGKAIQIKGVWRLWCEHAGGDNQVQGAKVKTPFKNANPDHVFEIHPITQVEDINCLKSLKPIVGFTPKKTEPAFHRYEITRCEIRKGKSTTTIITNGVGYNYVQFKMEMLDEVKEGEPQKKGGIPVEDEGRFIMGEIQDLDGELRVRRLRVAFVQGSEPEKRAKNLKPGQTLTLLGIPRISLKLVQWRVEHSAKDPDVLKWHLPYEIVAVGVYDDDSETRLHRFSDPFTLARPTSRMPPFSLPSSFVSWSEDRTGDGKADVPKIHAKTPARVVTDSVAIRNSEQLGKLQNTEADKASAALAKALKVKSIDWKKQMVIVISGGQQRTGGYSVEAKSLEVKDGKLIVHWKLNSPAPGSIVTQALTTPTLTILVDHFDGDVVFEPKAPAVKK